MDSTPQAGSRAYLPQRAQRAIEAAALRPDGGALKLLRRIVVFVLGISTLLVGVVMLVTPGPALVVIPVGLAILATEFVWAKKTLEWGRQRFNVLKDQVLPDKTDKSS